MSTFIVPAPKARVTQFEFGVPRPRRWYWPFKSIARHSIPLVQYLDIDVRLVLAGSVAGVTNENLDEAKAKVIWEAQVAVLDRYAPGVSPKLTNDQLVEVFRAWLSASDFNVGESSASSVS